MALANAPLYQVVLSEEGDVESIENKLHIIEKEDFAADPEGFDKAIRDNWKMTALPDAWKELLQEQRSDLLQLVRKGLPSELYIEDEEILDFLQTLESPHLQEKLPKPQVKKKPPKDWEQLLTSIEPHYERDRRHFQSGYYRKLGDYLISEHYKPWSKAITWKLVGTPHETNERKRLDNVIALFRAWRFIEKAEDAKYQRVEKVFRT